MPHWFIKKFWKWKVTPPKPYRKMGKRHERFTKCYKYGPSKHYKSFQGFTVLWNELCPLYHPTAYFKVISINVTAPGDRSYKKVIKSKWWHRGGALIQQGCVLIGRETRELSFLSPTSKEVIWTHSLKMARWLPLASQESRSEGNPNC